MKNRLHPLQEEHGANYRTSFKGELAKSDSSKRKECINGFLEIWTIIDVIKIIYEEPSC